MEMEDRQKVKRCGILGVHPSYLQQFSGKKSFSAVYSISNLIAFGMYMYYITQITSIERLYGMSSTETGWVLTACELGYLIGLGFGTFFARPCHVPRFLCYLTLLNALTGMLVGLPQAFSGNSMPKLTANGQDEKEDRAGLCYSSADDVPVTFVPVTSFTANSTSAIPRELDTNPHVRAAAIAIITTGMTLMGVTKGPCFPQVSNFIDENTNKRETGFYMGIITSVSIFGPALAYGFGSIFSGIYVTLEDVNIKQTDPRWIGAWWLGFLLIGVALILTSLPLMFFPRHLNEKSVKLFDKKVKANRNYVKSDCMQKIQHMLKSILNVLRNSLVITALGAASFNVHALASVLAYEPKYMESQFQIPSWKSNIMLSVISISSMCLGTLFGGWLTKVIRISAVRCVLISIMFCAATITLVFIGMFLGCSQPKFKNIVDNGTPSLDSACSTQCKCDSSAFIPICGVDESNYYTPCVAGCYNGIETNYYNCTCIPGSTASAGMCDSNCSMMWPWSATKFLANFCDACTAIPFFLIFIRSVTPEEKPLAIGLSALAASVIGWLPGPLIGGRLVDSTCILWSVSSTQGRYCSLYNIEWFRFRMHGYTLGLRGASFLLLLLCLWLAKRAPMWRADDDDYEKDKEADMPDKDSFIAKK